jgi:hypothetical protein
VFGSKVVAIETADDSISDEVGAVEIPDAHELAHPSPTEDLADVDELVRRWR